MQRVLAYIEDHLHDDLTLDHLAEVSGYSKFHFHRLFTACYGLSVHRYVRIARMERAAYRLAYRNQESILEIALTTGYEGPEAFARAFRQMFGQSPSDFRADPTWSALLAVDAPILKHRSQTNRMPACDIRIEHVEPVRVAVLEHRGDPATLGDSIRRFIAFRRANGLHPSVSATYNILRTDPATTPPEDFRLDLCAATGRELPVGGLVENMIPGGRCAVLRYVGTEDGFRDAVQHLYRHWLPNSGESLRDFPIYCRRVTFFPDVAEHEAITDIYLPLA